MERAQLLKEARLKRRLTREQAAERFGVDPSTVKRWENGTSTPQPINLYSIMEIYDITPQELGYYELPSTEDAPVVTQNATTFEDEEDEEDVITSFRKQDLTSYLMHIVWNWLLSCHHARYQELQTLITLELEDYSRMHPDNINRRNALRRMALLAIDLCALSAHQPVMQRPVEEILTYCASGIVACWYLRKGKELAFADGAVSKYIPTLKEIAKSAQEPQRIAAAELLAQSLLLKATCVEQLYGNYDASLLYRKQAETYSEQAGNLTLSLAAMRAQAVSYDYADDWERAMHTAAKAKNIIETTEAKETPHSLMLQSYVYAGLANYLAHMGPAYKEDALISIGQAQAAFDEAVENKETAPIWIGYDEGNLLLNSGLAYHHLGMPQKAIDSFAKIDQLPVAHETNRVGSFIHQVVAEVNREDRSPDMAFCIDRWKRGIQGAITLHSGQVFNEAIQVYGTMRVVWRGEQRIKNLREYIKHW
jgi:transcriptional regulator with XRE-family HTH domain